MSRTITSLKKLLLEKKNNKIYLLFSAVVALVFLTATNNYAIPNFARQTNLSCKYCHYTYPTLTSFGRMFKLNGYTLTNIEMLEGVSPDSGRTTLKIPQTFSFSASVKSSYTSINKAEPGLRNSFVQSPEGVSLFLAGEVTPKIGAYVETAYSLSEGTIGIEMLDIRYADHTKLWSKDLLYGLTLNNAPTTQDVWNSTPAWGFPYFFSKSAPSPTATLLQSTMNNVAGLGAYALYDKLIYAEVSLYRSSPAGVSYPPGPAWREYIKGFAPYWRLAVQQQWKDQYLAVGTYGIFSAMYPSGVTGLTNNYTDIGLDAQYEKTIDNGSSILLHATYITEKQNLDAYFNSEQSANSNNNLNSFKFDCTYNFPDWVSLSAGFFLISGTGDAFLYTKRSVTGSFNGKPNSNGEIFQLTFLPWVNTQFAVQYTLYNKFNGSSSNYDGSGRNASNNNTLYLLGWFVF